MNQKKVVEKISPYNVGLLKDLYKEVFSGHPWHEDMICSGALLSRENPSFCMVQYTERSCCEDSCSDLSVSRDQQGVPRGLVFLCKENNLDTCPGCGEQLNPIPFYPDYVDHVALMDEAVSLPGFKGYILTENDFPVGFSWGYPFPSEPTKSVNFPVANKVLRERGINHKKCFYTAEIGVVEDYQRGGNGSILSTIKLRDAARDNYKHFILRTINPAVHKIFGRTFKGKDGEVLFTDPERGNNWFMWNLKDFDGDYVFKVLNNGLSKW